MTNKYEHLSKKAEIKGYKYVLNFILESEKKIIIICILFAKLLIIVKNVFKSVKKHCFINSRVNQVLVLQFILSIKLSKIQKVQSGLSNPKFQIRPDPNLILKLGFGRIRILDSADHYFY